MKKMISVLLVFTMVISVFSCCEKKENERYVMTYNGYYVTESMYKYWLSSYKRNILFSISGSSDTDEFWHSDQGNGQSVEEYYTDVIQRRIKDYLISQYLFDQYGLELSDKAAGKIEEDVNEKIDYYGSEEELNKALSDVSIDIDKLKTIYTWEEKHSAVYDYLYGQGGKEEADASDIISYYNENYSRIQYIVFYKSEYVTDEKGNTVYDDDGNAVTRDLNDDELKSLMKKIDECDNKLKNGASFKNMMNEYSQYNTLKKYPNGFFVSDNELSTWGEKIINDAKKAHEGEIFKIDEDGAIYIVLKGELTAFDKLSDTDLSQLKDLNTYVSKKLYEDKYSSIANEISVDKSVTNDNNLSLIKSNPYYSI